MNNRKHFQSLMVRRNTSVLHHMLGCNSRAEGQNHSERGSTPNYPASLGHLKTAGNIWQGSGEKEAQDDVVIVNWCSLYGETG